MTHVFNFFRRTCRPAPRRYYNKPPAEMLDWHGSGMSVMEMSHRGPGIHLDL
jgi:phosphoserine aminotransferase